MVEPSHTASTSSRTETETGFLSRQLTARSSQVPAVIFSLQSQAIEITRPVFTAYHSHVPSCFRTETLFAIEYPLTGT